MSTKPTSEKGDALFLCGLSLERCGIYLSHLCACVHLLDKQEESLLEIVAGLERELTVSRNLLGQAAE